MEAIAVFIIHNLLLKLFETERIFYIKFKKPTPAFFRRKPEILDNFVVPK